MEKSAESLNQREILEENESDRIQLLRIFPEEIWEKILERISDSTDMMHIINSSLFFRNRLPQNRTIFLFPKVWEILGKMFETNPNYFEELESNDEEQHQDTISSGDEYGENENAETWSVGYVIYPEGFDDIEDAGTRWLRQVLKYRLVCRTWNTAVETFYQNLPEYYKMEHDLNPKEENVASPVQLPQDEIEVGGWAQLEFKPNNTEYLQQFLRQFEATHFVDVDNSQNPFLSRNVAFSFNSDDQRFLNEITEILSRYGRHIWYATFISMDDFPSRRAYYSKLREFLELLPNLKVLKILYIRDHFDYHTLRFVAFPMPLEEMQELRQEIFMNPLGHLENLQFLKTKNMPAPIFNELIRVCGNVSMLEALAEGDHGHYDIYTRPLPNLKQLSMQYNFEREFFHLADPQVDWNLTNLYLDFDQCTLMEWSRVFAVLESKWDGTLTDIMIRLPKNSLARLLVGPGFDQNQLVERRVVFKKLVLDHIIEFLGNFEEETDHVGGSIWRVFPKLQNLKVSACDHWFGNGRGVNYYSLATRKECLTGLGESAIIMKPKRRRGWRRFCCLCW